MLSGTPLASWDRPCGSGGLSCRGLSHSVKQKVRAGGNGVSWPLLKNRARLVARLVSRNQPNSSESRLAPSTTRRHCNSVATSARSYSLVHTHNSRPCMVPFLSSSGIQRASQALLVELARLYRGSSRPAESRLLVIRPWNKARASSRLSGRSRRSRKSVGLRAWRWSHCRGRFWGRRNRACGMHPVVLASPVGPEMRLGGREKRERLELVI